MAITSPENEDEMENSQTVMDSFVGIYDGVENKEIYLVVVSEFEGDAGVGRKSSPNLRRKSSPSQLRR